MQNLRCQQSQPQARDDDVEVVAIPLRGNRQLGLGLTGRGFPLALNHAEALAQEIVSVARRASEVGLWEPMEIPTPDDAA